MKKLRVGILFGGRSGEHEVSQLSAASVPGAAVLTQGEAVVVPPEPVHSSRARSGKTCTPGGTGMDEWKPCAC